MNAESEGGGGILSEVILLIFFKIDIEQQ